MFARGSAHIDWCEQNYVYNDVIAEFWNCVSNVLFLIIPVLLIYLFIPYGQHVTRLVHLVWLMLIAVGISSAYFHATLSLLGQLLDEVAILWVIIAAYATWYPKQYLPLALQENNRIKFRCICGVVCVFATATCMIKPAWNPIFLNMFAIPSALLLAREIYRSDSARVRSLGLRSTIFWLIAISCWAYDFWLCDSLSSFPYLHCVWHIFILLASYTCLIVFAHLEAMHQVPHLSPQLVYWPLKDFEWGVPYVKFQEPLHSAKYL